jgi:DNA-binding NarL/FixJ family response regulator
MPVMNGLDAALVLKRLMPSVPLMMYSAFDDRSSERRARAIGISELVSKSERFSVLVDKARGLVYSKAA